MTSNIGQLRLKKYFAKVPIQYLGDTKPVLGLEKGVHGLFAPLHQTRYKSINGWSKKLKEHRSIPENPKRRQIYNFHDFDEEAPAHSVMNSAQNRN